jgi:hypothetical protein
METKLASPVPDSGGWWGNALSVRTADGGRCGAGRDDMHWALSGLTPVLAPRGC